MKNPTAVLVAAIEAAEKRAMSFQSQLFDAQEEIKKLKQELVQASYPSTQPPKAMRWGGGRWHPIDSKKVSKKPTQ